MLHRRELVRRTAIKHGSRVLALLKADGERLYRLLVRLTLREDVADDLLQDLVVKLAQARGFPEAENPYGYARTAAIHLAFNWMRQRRREQALEGYEQESVDLPPWTQLVQKEDIRRMLDSIEELAEQDRLILAMRYFDQASHEEIGSAIGRTAHQARGLCHKAIKRLRVAMIRPDGRPLATREEVGP